MGFIRRAVRAAGLCLWLILVAPALALGPAAFLDRGPTGQIRPTLFPFALATLDPFVRTASSNSVTGASVVALGSLLLGSGLARVLTGWRYWGRGLLGPVALAAVAIPPVLVALGLRLLLVNPLQADNPSWGGSSLPWVCWVWAEMVVGVPLVALATASALGRVEPAWVDAARLAGASRLRIWWQLIWPAVRPSAFRATAAVFTLSLVEPGAPLVLGLRRTLAFQIVEATLSVDPMPRSAVLALEAAALALLGRILLNWWGGRSSPALPPPSDGETRSRDASGLRATASLGFLILGVVLAWLPVVALFGSAFSPSTGRPAASVGQPVSRFFHRLHDAGPGRLAFHSLALGLGVVAIQLVAARTLTVRPRRRKAVLRLARWPAAFPPLSIGVGALALGWLCGLGADWVRQHAGPRFLVASMERLSQGLDPVQTPGTLLLLGVAAASQSTLLHFSQRLGRRSRTRLSEVAMNLGASWSQAQRAGLAGWFGIPPGALMLTLVLAASNLSPALILTPTAEGRPVTPQLLALADEPSGARSTAAALAVCVLAANLLGLGLAARTRSESLGDWFHGRP